MGWGRMERSGASCNFRVFALVVSMVVLLGSDYTEASAVVPIPTSADRIRFFEPGQAPPHVVLGIVHAVRRQGQQLHSLFEEAALEARARGGDIVVHTIVGGDDPLHEGYTVWVLGMAARSIESTSAIDTLRACPNCLVRWRFDSGESGMTDAAQVARLEAKAFATSRLKLARNGYYLLRRLEEGGGDGDSTSANQMPPLALDLSVYRKPEGESQDRLSFAWRMAWTRTGETYAEFAHSMRILRGQKFELVGRDSSTTHNALSAVYSRLPSHYKDSDGDGVPDSIDLEPNTPIGYQVDYRGKTLDSDGDGIPNTIDAQPFTVPKYRRMVGRNGVPIVTDDADYDGVRDDLDDCDSTNVRYEVDERGCPVLEKEIVTVLVDRGVLRERRILFETGKAALLERSTARLDSLGVALSDLPELAFNIDGHCDDRGTVEFNQILSEQRAAAVIQYLLRTFPGLRPEQFTARGFGKSLPILNEPTDAARELNRRVEITVKNPEDARRQVEGTRYRLRNEAVDGYQFEARSGE